MAGIDYNHHLDTLLVEDNYSVGVRGAGSLGPVDAIAFLDNQRLAVFCGLSVSGRSQLSVLTLDTNDAEILQALPRMLFKAKNPAGELVTGEVLADDARYALVTLRQHGLVPIAVESKSAGEKTFVYSTNAAGQPLSGSVRARNPIRDALWGAAYIGQAVSGSVQARNSAAATAQIEELGLRPTLVVEIPQQLTGRWSNDQTHDERVSALRNRQTLISGLIFTYAGRPPEGGSLEIHGLAASGDGRRLAVAGRSMTWRWGDSVLGQRMPVIVPLNAEVQVWDAVEMKLLVTLKGPEDAIFRQVALDQAGGSSPP